MSKQSNHYAAEDVAADRWVEANGGWNLPTKEQEPTVKRGKHRPSKRTYTPIWTAARAMKPGGGKLS